MNKPIKFFLHWLTFYLLTAPIHSTLAKSENEKWIVITSINYPTDQVKRLAQLPGWHIVVVADKKTPKDWSLKGCDFLSVEKQLALEYRITKLLPWNHYSRKNIGYLYAIQHGAKIIYDTDDDNIIIGNTIEYYPKKCILQTLITNQNTVNPYALYGQPTVWPRGYPLEEIQVKRTYTLEQQAVRPFIQQGLVNNDPDVDAIYRLTRELPIFFENKPPICMPPGIMAPFNSQNTVFHYEAFWGLVIPIAVAFRVSDIWRGYWVQRMLWDIGGNLSFLSPTALQERNAHNYYKDFLDEHDLYCQAGSLIKALYLWKSEEISFFHRIIDLHKMMVEKGFFKPCEIEFIQAWIDDLQSLGYNNKQ